MKAQSPSVYIRAGHNAYHIGSTLFGQVTLGDNPYREEPARKLWTKGFTDARNKLAPKPIFKKGFNENRGTERQAVRPGGNSKVLHKRVAVRQGGGNSLSEQNSGHSLPGSGQKAAQGKQTSNSWSSWDSHVAARGR